jgi:hypothetical protein
MTRHSQTSLRARPRKLVVGLVILLISLSTYACGRMSSRQQTTAVLSLAKLGLAQRNASSEGEVSLVSVSSVAQLPPTVRARIGNQMADPGGLFNAGDVSVPGIPNRRLLFAGISDRYCVVHYEMGGFSHGYVLAFFELSTGKAQALWAHAGIKYNSLEEFASETDPDAFENQVKTIVW